MPIATRLTNTGTLLVNGSFDENTSITPANFRTTSTMVSAGTLDEVTGMVATNGMIAYIDAGKLESYPGAGTSVRDLVNPATNPATLNGTISYVSAGSASYWNFATGAATNYITSTLAQNYLDCTLVFYPDFTYNSGASLAMGLGAGISADKTMRFGSANGTGPWTLNNPGNTDDWASTATTYYINNTAYTGAGSLVSGWNIVGGLRTNTTNGAFASNFAYTWGTGYTGRYYQGRLAAIVLYNRRLTADEQQNNYNYFASRYGLTPATNPPVKRESSDGTLYVNTQFDEFTGAPVVDTSLQLWLDSGQTASYPGTGTTWTDLSGQSNTGTLTNSPTFSSTVGGGTFLFNGTNQTATTVSLNLQQNFTLEAWVNPSVLNGFSIFGQGTTAANQGLHIWYNSATTIRFGMFANDTDFTVSTSTGTWYHMIFTYNNSSPYTKGFYLNAVAQSGTTQQTQSAYAGSGTFRLGAIYSTAGNYGNGYFEGVKMYNRILTADEVTTNFNALRGRYGI